MEATEQDLTGEVTLPWVWLFPVAVEMLYLVDLHAVG